MRYGFYALILALSACSGGGGGTSTPAPEAVTPPPASPPPPPVTTPARCNKSDNLSIVEKPRGVFSSVLTHEAVAHPEFRGGLIRVPWSDIEPSPDNFDFTAIEEQLALLPAGTEWSLAVMAGWTSVDETDPDLYDGSTFPDGTPRPKVPLHMSPDWMTTDLGIETFDMPFRDVTVHMPKYWDSAVQARFTLLADALNGYLLPKRNIRLIYIPQMTSNGIEGHFNGVSYDVLIKAAGIDPAAPDADTQFENIWVNAALSVSRIFADGLPDKALAFEVHDVIGRSTIPGRIIAGFLDDSGFENRVGAAMWWLSGNTTYQPELVQLLMDYQGDLYGQVIGNSSQTDRFPDGDYTAVFQHGKDLCMRYVEVWNYEFETAGFDAEIIDYNDYANGSFDR